MSAAEPLYSVIHFYEKGHFFQTQFKEDEYDKMIEFINGLRFSNTEYTVFKGDDIYDVETGKTWNPLKELERKRKGVV